MWEKASQAVSWQKDWDVITPSCFCSHCRGTLASLSGSRMPVKTTVKQPELLPTHCLQTTDEPHAPFILLLHILILCCVIYRKHWACISLQRDMEGEKILIQLMKGERKKASFFGIYLRYLTDSYCWAKKRFVLIITSKLLHFRGT